MILAVDTSAIVAFLQGEEDAEVIAACLGAADRKLMTSATRLECSIVVESQLGPAGAERFRLFLDESGIEIVPFTPQDAILAAEAYRRFGKGRGHPARLNFGDCFAYALAKSRDLPLLFKGDDFSRTDLRPALNP